MLDGRGLPAGSVLGVREQGKTQVQRRNAPDVPSTRLKRKTAEMRAVQGARGFPAGRVLGVCGQGKTQVQRRNASNVPSTRLKGKTAEIRAVQGMSSTTQGAYSAYVSKGKRKYNEEMCPTFRLPVETKNGGDASSSRHVEHDAGNVLRVREQGARRYNEEMRRIYVVFKQ